jgi:hypothetical protein
MLQRFRDELILPHIPRLRAFDPLGFEGLSRGSARNAYEA